MADIDDKVYRYTLDFVSGSGVEQLPGSPARGHPSSYGVCQKGGH